MLDDGDITPTQYRQASRDANLHLKPGRLYTQIREPYFFSYVRDQLIAEYGANTVRSGGLRVYTTIDPRLQRAAREGDHGHALPDATTRPRRSSRSTRRTARSAR